MKQYIEKQLKSLKVTRRFLTSTPAAARDDQWNHEWSGTTARLMTLLDCLEALPSLAIQQIRLLTPQAIKEAEESIESLEVLRSFPMTKKGSSDNASCMMREMKLIEQLKTL